MIVGYLISLVYIKISISVLMSLLKGGASPDDDTNNEDSSSLTETNFYQARIEFVRDGYSINFIPTNSSFSQIKLVLGRHLPLIVPLPSNFFASVLLPSLSTGQFTRIDTLITNWKYCQL